MKQTKTLLRVVPLLLLLALLLSACGKNDPWAEATYLEDTTLGEGIFTVTIKVTADDKTDLAEAMLAEELCAGEEGAYGLYIKYVNGIRADYDLDGGYYWNLLVNGEASMIGASGTPIIAGDIYEFVRTK